jgi:hypothetical protein
MKSTLHEKERENLILNGLLPSTRQRKRKEIGETIQIRGKMAYPAKHGNNPFLIIMERYEGMLK